VQLWSSLESVFTTGDIAKQLPAESKKFVKIDKEWLRVMTRAEEVRNVTATLTNGSLRYAWGRRSTGAVWFIVLS
jgi:dynein heavy chain